MSSPFTTTIAINVALAKEVAEYLQKRGLSGDDFPDGLVPFDGRVDLRTHSWAQRSGRSYILFEYLGPDGEPYIKDKEKWAVARFFGPAINWKGDDPPPKTVGPSGRPHELHFEPLNKNCGGATWLTLPPDVPIVICESYIKAKCIHKYTDLPSIGLNGVDSHSRNQKLIFDRYDFDWHGRTLFIVYDSDVCSNDRVKLAREKLAFRAATAYGMKVKIVTIEPDHDEKIGPDDFIVRFGADKFMQRLGEATDYNPAPNADLVARMNDLAVYDRATGGVIDRDDKKVRKWSHASNMYANIIKEDIRQGPNGAKIVTMSGFEMWRNSPDRNTVDAAKYVYLGDEFIEEEDETYYNLFRKPGAEPIEGMGEMTKKIIDHFYRTFGEHTELVRSYVKFLRFTGDKPTSCAILHSTKRGVGKGFFGKVAEKIVGRFNTKTVTAASFEKNFNAELEGRRLVVAHEFQPSGAVEKRHALNALKLFLGDKDLVIEHKGLNSYTVENMAGLIITCNRVQDVPTDGVDDRRMFYVNCDGGQGLSEVEWKAFHKALDDPRVIGELAYWFQQGENIDFSTWRPPLTEDKLEAIEAGMPLLPSECLAFRRECEEDQRQPVAFYYNTLKMLIVGRLGSDAEKYINSKTLPAALQDSGWEKTAKVGRSAATQGRLYLVSRSIAAKMSTTQLLDEADRTAKMFTMGKY